VIEVQDQDVILIIFVALYLPLETLEIVEGEEVERKGKNFEDQRGQNSSTFNSLQFLN